MHPPQALELLTIALHQTHGAPSELGRNWVAAFKASAGELKAYRRVLQAEEEERMQRLSTAAARAARGGYGQVGGGYRAATAAAAAAAAADGGAATAADNDVTEERRAAAVDEAVATRMPRARWLVALWRRALRRQGLTRYPKVGVDCDTAPSCGVAPSKARALGH